MSIDKERVLSGDTKMGDAITKRMAEITEELLGVDKNKITPDSNFNDDIGVDSETAVDLTMRFEEEFGVPFPGEAGIAIQTIGEAANYVETQCSSTPTCTLNTGEGRGR